MKLYLKKVKFK